MRCRERNSQKDFSDKQTLCFLNGDEPFHPTKLVWNWGLYGLDRGCGHFARTNRSHTAPSQGKGCDTRPFFVLTETFPDPAMGLPFFSATLHMGNCL
jgi:hypothetical protein